jgi:hypothetical protein
MDLEMKALALVAFVLVASCADAVNNCQRQLDLCLRRSPPGAATTDCYAQYDACTRMPRPGATGPAEK